MKIKEKKRLSAVLKRGKFKKKGKKRKHDGGRGQIRKMGEGVTKRATIIVSRETWNKLHHNDSR
jgi:hypothetical protein